MTEATQTEEKHHTRGEIQRARREANRSAARRAARRTLGLTLLAVVLGIGFFAFRPQSMGGTVDYISVHGSSMIPTLHNGDLVVVRRAARYHVGEIVSFRVPAGEPHAGLVVIHRIVGGGPTGYLTKGDHNYVTDPWHPTRGEIVGSRWFTVAYVAEWASWLRWVALGTVALCTLLLALSYRRKRLPRHQHHGGTRVLAPAAVQSR